LACCVFFFIPQLDNHPIKPGKSLKVNISVPNLRLFVGNIPKSKGKEEILEEFAKTTGKWIFFFFSEKALEKWLTGGLDWEVVGLGV